MAVQHALVRQVRCHRARPRFRPAAALVWPVMTDLRGINHLTLSTIDLDRLVAYYSGLLGAELAFERAATPSAPRIAVVDVGGNDHLMIVENAAPSVAEPDPLGGAEWGLRVETYEQLCEVRERILAAGLPVEEIETLPTQWTMTARDPDGRPVDVRVHRTRPV
jgi:catechol 2,3-dioxygenase-like lactoylglutathione lyase family enzyme